MARAERPRPPLIRGKKHSLQPFLQPTSKEHTFSFKTHFIYGTPHFAILSGDAGMHIAQEVGKQLEKEVPPNPPRFSNNEIRVAVPQAVATKDVYIIQATDQNPDAALKQLKLMEEGAKGVGANRITAILTHMPYSRQDRRDQKGAPEAARLTAREIFEAGWHSPYKSWINPFKQKHETKIMAKTNLLVVDVHSEDPLQRVTLDSKFQWANLDSGHVLIPALQKEITINHLDVAIAFPDTTAAKRYKEYAKLFGGGIEQAAIVKKVRPTDKNNVVGLADNQEDFGKKVFGKDVVMVDDIGDTFGTALQAAKEFKKNGAKSVRLVVTHGIFSGNALDKIADSAFDGIIVTDTITQREEVIKNQKIQIVPIAPLIAKAIVHIENRQPLGKLAKNMSKGFEKSYQRWDTVRLGKVNKYRRRNLRKIA